METNMTGDVFFGFTILFLIGAVVVTLLYLINEIKKEDFYIAIGTVGGLFLISSIIACIYWAGDKLTNLELFYLIGFLLFLSVFTFTFLFRYSSTNKLEDETVFISVCAISGVLTLLFLILLTVSVSRGGEKALEGGEKALEGGGEKYLYNERGCIYVEPPNILNVYNVYRQLITDSKIKMNIELNTIDSSSVLIYCISCLGWERVKDYLVETLKGKMEGNDYVKYFVEGLRNINSSESLDQFLRSKQVEIFFSDPNFLKNFRGSDNHLLLESITQSEYGTVIDIYSKTISSGLEQEDAIAVLKPSLPKLQEKNPRIDKGKIVEGVEKSVWKDPFNESPGVEIETGFIEELVDLQKGILKKQET